MNKIIICLLSIMGFINCSNAQNNEQNMKSIVIYFSHAGENYGVGNVKEGNTKLVADIIGEQTGADLLEIVCVKDYNMGYADLCDLAKKEQKAGELPGFMLVLNGSPVDGIDLDAYTTVYIGGPVWWGTYPQVMFTFFQQHDLGDKTIYPFTTHEGSGLGSCVSDLKRIYPKATFGTPFSLFGHEIRTDAGKKKVKAWLGE